MPDDMRRRRRIAAAAFTERRRELQLTQEQVAQRGDIVVRSVQNFESQGRWPNARTRAALERAVGWEPGAIEHIASGSSVDGGAPLLAAIDRLQAELDQLREPASDVSLGRKTIRVILKGGDEHVIPLGRKATAALDRYMRSRARHREAASDWLWLGLQGRNPAHFGSAGIQDMLERRGKLIGIPRLTPHYFRRTAAHDMLVSGLSEDAVMKIAGWKTSAMVRKYAGALAAERARELHAKHSPGDRF